MRLAARRKTRRETPSGRSRPAHLVGYPARHRRYHSNFLDLSNLCRRAHVNDPTAINGGPDRALSPENLAEITKERDSLREELKEQENSYFDLLKRFEKLRETCTTLKAVCKLMVRIG